MSQLAQLALFEGPHVPRMAAREALSRGDLRAAHTQLAGRAGAKEEAADATRLARIDSALRAAGGDSVEAVHAAFASALAAAEPRGFLSGAEWFGLYAQRVADALDAEPGRSFRGWLGADFAFAAGEPDAARRAVARIIEVVPPGSAWIAAARLAFALGEAANASEWIHTACLDGPVAPADLVAEPPALERCGAPALDAAPPLPPLPAPVEDVFDAARALDGLPGSWTRWAAVVGEIDRVLAPPSPDDAAPSARAEDGRSDGDDPARAFLAALRAARRSRERDRPHSSGSCSDRELRARRRMQRIAPDLLARYLRGLGGVLF